MWPVFVLLWSHTLMRKWNLFRSLFELLFPVFYLLLIYYLSNITIEQEEPKKINLGPYGSGQSETRDPVRVLYEPEIELTNQLMDRAGAKLNLNRLDHLPGNNETGYFPFSNIPALTIARFSKSMKPTDAIVIFEGMESFAVPMTLNYTIRIKDNLNTQKYDYIPPGFTNNWFPQSYFGMKDTPFLPLQWAIDTSYLSMRSDTDVNQTLMLQELSDQNKSNDIAISGCLLACFFLPLSLASLFTYLTDRLFEGKNSGIHELIKMVGVSWRSICVSHVLDLAPNFLIYSVGGTLLFKLTEIVRKTGWGFVFAAMALHFMTLVALAFVVIYAFKMTDHLTLLSSGIYFLIWVLSWVSIAICKEPTYAWLVSCFMPQVAITRFWLLVAAKEQLVSEVTISDMWNDNAALVPVGHLYLCMVIQVVLFFLFASYLARVRPGEYGQALPWNYLCRKEYWGTKPRSETAPEQVQTVSEDDQRYFEKTPVGLPIGIQIINVHKSFGKEVVLQGVNLTVYKGEITILLGHNGAGKTTLISIITGLISATSGRVLVEGKDTVTQAEEVRKTIGLCPQQNIFFPHLTVLQHVMFFGMLKGETYAGSKASAAALLVKLLLDPVAHLETGQLSGGMKRRTQLACAVAGGATVLVMDEPTSGLDVETRRELWNLLQSLRGDRTVLLTTHFMEEADALGDRIAALHHGVLRCQATAMFLKRAIGTGYRLSCTTVGAPNESAITAAITSIVPDAALHDLKPNGVAYNLPANDTAKFPALFTVLEERRTELGIDIIGVGKSTLDDVFMELCSDEKPTSMVDSEYCTVEPSHEKETGFKLCARQFAILLLRQWHYATSGICSLLFMTSFLILLLWLVTSLTNNWEPKSSKTEALDLDLNTWTPERRALVNVGDANALAALRASNPTVEFQQVPDVAKAALRSSRGDTKEYERFQIGIELNNTIAKVLFTTRLRHAAPVGVNLLSNALAAQVLGDDGRTITTRYHPLDSHSGNEAKYVEIAENIKDVEKTEYWCMYIVFLIFMYMCKFARLPCAERASGARLALIAAGCPRALFWAASLTGQLAQALVLCALPAIVCAAAVDKEHTFNQTGFLLAMCMLLLLGFLAFLSFAYLISTIANARNATISLFSIVFICTMITPSIPRTSNKSALSLFFSALADTSDFSIPPHTLVHGLQQATKVALANAFCVTNRMMRCPDLFGPEPFDDEVCCDSPDDSEPYSYWETEDAAGMCMATLAIQAVLYFTLMYVTDRGFFSWLLDRVCPQPPPRHSPQGNEEDPAIRDEAAYVSETVKLSKNQIPDAVLCNNVQKIFPGSCKHDSVFAVKKISFSIKKGECFGLLGVNGAGKSTTFKMLTGETWPTKGDIYSDGQELGLCKRDQYTRTLSYCPQFFGTDYFLTGRQNLVLLLTLRGWHDSDVKAISDSWIKEVGLERHADKRVSSYSGGCARRLVAAAALCQRARTVLLDEPTAGVDPAARRSMHRALLRARRYGALVIASHSLDEIEALCHRIAIMSGGEVRALGTASALKAQYGAGHSIIFKLNHAQSDGAMLEDFKGEMQRRFNCTLLDQHQTMLSYNLKDRLHYSELFESVEGLKQKFPDLIEDYMVTETTLEDVFLALAKEARAPGV